MDVVTLMYGLITYIIYAYGIIHELLDIIFLLFCGTVRHEHINILCIYKSINMHVFRSRTIYITLSCNYIYIIPSSSIR